MLQDRSPRIPLLGRPATMAAGGLLLAWMAVVAGVAYTWAEHAKATASWRARLSSMADDRKAALEAWSRELQDDAASLGNFPVIQETAQAIAQGKEPATLQDIAGILAAYSRQHGSPGAAIFRENDSVLAAAPGTPLTSECRAKARQVAQGSAPVLTMILSGGAGKPVVATFYPISTPAGTWVVLVFSDTDTWLYPFLKRESFPTRSAETMIMGGDGHTLRYLSPLRFSASPPLTLRRPQTDTVLAGSVALKGVETFGEFVDYRGVEIFAVTSQIPSMRIGLVVKVDRSEALQEVRESIWDITLALLGFLLGTSGLVYAAIRNRRLKEATASEARIRHLNRLLKTTIEVNHLTAKETSRSALLEQTCEILVGAGGFKMVWIGFKDEVLGHVHPVAYAGFDEGYLAGLVIRWDDSPEGRGPTGTAIREGREVVCHDLETDPDLAPWREAARVRGYRTIAAFPVRIGQEVEGALTVYGSEPGSIGGEEMTLLASLAGDLSFALTALRDKGLRMHAETALGKSEERFRTILENLGEGVALLDSQGTVLFANRAANSIADLPEGGLLGRNVQEFLSADEEGVIQEQRRLRRQGLTSVYETTVSRADGQRRHLLLTATPHMDAEGRFAGSYVVFMDITERKQAAAQLQAILEGMPDGVVVVNASGDVVLANARTEALFGYPREELLGKSIEVLVPEQARDNHRRGRAEYMTAQKTRPMSSGRDLKARKRDGTEFPVDVSLSTLEGPKGPMVISVIRDITDRKVLEEQLERARSLETIGMITGGVAHEVRNPLNSINLVTMALEKQLQGAPKYKEYIGHIQNQVGRLSRLMNDLLVLGQPQESVQCALCDLQMVVREAVSLVGAADTAAVGRFVVEAQSGPFGVSGVQSKLIQVFVNLLSNALSFSPEDEPVRVGMVVQDGMVTATVMDRGPGIPEKLLHDIFKPFQSQRKGGTGLGLAIVRKIVADHGGTVTAANNDPGPGATFTLRLPMEESKE